MAIEQVNRSEAVIQKRSPASPIRISKEEEGSAKGEIWAVLRALIAVVGAVVVIGYLIG